MLTVGIALGEMMTIFEYIARLEPWQTVLSLLGTGIATGYFVRRVVEKLLNPEFFELKARANDLEKEKDAELEKLKVCDEERRTAKIRLTKYEAVREAMLADEDELWRLHPEIPPPKYFDLLARSRTKIISIANHKGGVGKTTLTANLAAYFEKRLGKRCLLIDLDYQGSLSQAMLRSAGIPYAGSLANDLLSGAATGEELLKLTKHLQPVLPQSSIITANYELYSLENRLLLRWLLEEIDTDIRFHLGPVLLSPEVQAQYDVILLDTPPRLTTSAINALCASHYILIPTVPDMLSAQSVGRFMRHVKDLQISLNPALAVAGIVINLAGRATLNDSEKDAVASITRDLTPLIGKPHIFDRHIPRLSALSGAAGEEIAYLNDRMFREGIMNPLGDEIAQRIGFGVPNES